MSVVDVREIINEIDLGWINLHLLLKPDGAAYTLQIQDENLPPEFNTGRKWRISAFMTKSEIVGTAFAAVQAWFEHEIRELFTYRGRAVFGPHHDVDALWEVADRCEYREPVTA